MPITKQLTAPNGTPIGYHRVTHIHVDFGTGFARMTVRSHVNEQAAIDQLPHAWTDDYVVPTTSFDGALMLREDVEQAVVKLTDLPFYGGAVVADETGTLQAARERAWAAVKAARAVAEEGNFVFDGGSYQADKVRINGAVQLAVLAKASGSPFSEMWTLTDNTTRELDADQVIALGIALGQYVSDVFSTGRGLRAQINAAETIEEIQSIRWPA
jgi:hypothetical protein